MNKTLRTACFLSLCAALAACGAKGPLILPEKVVPIEAPEEAPEEAPTEAPAEAAPETPAPVDTTTTPADEQAEEAVETPGLPAAND
ncbi:MAG: lipoprotein [Pseudoxanthomonas sp.]